MWPPNSGAAQPSLDLQLDESAGSTDFTKAVTHFLLGRAGGTAQPGAPLPTARGFHNTKICHFLGTTVHCESDRHFSVWGW